MYSKLGKRNPIGIVAEKLLDIAVITVILAPILLLLSTAFKKRMDWFSPGVPFEPTLENYTAVFAEQLGAGPAFINSVLVAGLTIVIVIPIAVMSAFAFARIRFRLSRFILIYILACQFLPAVVMAIPYFMAMRAVRLTDTIPGLVLVNLSTTLPYAIWLILGYVQALPADIEEAAYVDGCSRIQAMARVTVPLIIPGILTSAIMAFITAWNEYLFAVIMTTKNARTLQVVLNLTKSAEGLNWGWMCAVASMVIVPVFMLSLPIRKHFVNGITMGSDR